ncbi:hypothetical protein CCP3SC5AM1_780003 [Gammaproteobacteria bacterium]
MISHISRTLSLLLLLITILFSFPAYSERYIDKFDGTVIDTTTNLRWMRCAMGQEWTGTTCSGNAIEYTWDQASALKKNFAGYDDWRLPHIRELSTLTDITTDYPPKIDQSIFPNTPSKWFWSDSLVTNDPNSAWRIHFNNGNISSNGRYNYSVVRLVHSAEHPSQSFLSLLNDKRPTEDYVDNEDGTVTHIPTCLVWKRCLVGQTFNGSICSAAPKIGDWSTMTALAGNGWRTPTLDELRSLVDYTSPKPTVNSLWFPNTPTTTPENNCWSNSLVKNNSSSAWFVSFADGSDYWNVRYGNLKSLRLVRNGQCTANLQIEKTGDGRVISNPVGIDCGSGCSNDYNFGTNVTLTASPASGSMFAGWSGGGCEGTGPCIVVMNGGQSVKAIFDPVTYLLTVAKSGRGAGTVTSNPDGINSGPDSSENTFKYKPGTTVTLTATPITGTEFTGWSGDDCSGIGTCILTMNTDKTVTAIFTLPRPNAPVLAKPVAGNAQVTLKWSTVAGATSYTVYQRLTAEEESRTPVTSTTGTSVTITGLTNNTKYFFKVAAVNSAGSSALSNEVNATPMEPKPDFLITDLSLNPDSPTLNESFTVNATIKNQGTGAGDAGYLDVNDVWADIGTLDAGMSTSVMLTLSARKVGTNTLRAFIDSQNETTESNETNNQRAKTYSVKPEKPTLIAAVAGNAKVTLKWSAAAGATSYQIYQGTIADGENLTTSVKSGIKGTSVTITGLTNGMKYFFKMNAVNSRVTSALSNEISATPIFPLAAPVIEASPGNKQVTLRWKTVAGATGYNVYQGTTMGGEYMTPVKSGIKGTRVTITDLINDTQYFFKMSAINATVTSALSNEVNATPKLNP